MTPLACAAVRSTGGFKEYWDAFRELPGVQVMNSSSASARLNTHAFPGPDKKPCVVPSCV